MLNVVILAAGKGTRMQSNLPKVMHSIAGKPMLEHVLQTVSLLEPAAIVVVTGHGASQVQKNFGSLPSLTFVTQSPQLGTGHAVQQALPMLKQADDSVTLVLYGDVPLVQASTLRLLLNDASKKLCLLTETLSDPTGYGRIVRDDKGNVRAIVEHKDASPDQLAIREVNTGIIAGP